MPKVDVLIIGSGIAGLSAAIKIAQHFPDHKICVVTKAAAAESNTHYAQGGISAVVDLLNDSLESHVHDTLLAGDGLCNEEVVRYVVGHARDRIDDLVSSGVAFDRDDDGKFSLGREGGHRHNRIIHCKDATGASVSTSLLAHLLNLPNAILLTDKFVVDLIKNKETNYCVGASILNESDNSIDRYLSRVTILATGGLGQLYKVTTNPLVATGDGFAMAWRAGAKVSNMEFIQFHPTALAGLEDNPCFLISEAVRGHGAYLLNGEGERFMNRYHDDGELACRDVVARAIAREIRSSGKVCIDCRHIANGFSQKFPTIYSKCKHLGIDLFRDPIPVAPAAHYACGGIDVDLNARTNILNLYAVGECANTGLHGANRLASNSLLEAMVFAHNCYVDISKRLGSLPSPAERVVEECAPTHAEKLFDVCGLRRAIQHLMNDHAGIVRCDEGLTLAKEALLQMREMVMAQCKTATPDRAIYELRNMVDVALLVLKQSLARKENRGSFYNTDNVSPQARIQATPYPDNLFR